MYCPECGVRNNDQVTVCTECGTELNPEINETVGEETGVESRKEYAGFWMRFLAFFVDSIILGVVSMVFNTVLLSPFVTDMQQSAPGQEEVLTSGMMTTLVLIYILGIVINWLYFTVFEASSKQATPGKMLVGLKVTDSHGDRLSFARANGRYWGKILSFIILFIGFIMAGFTEKKQALHDLIASTLVVKE